MDNGSINSRADAETVFWIGRHETERSTLVSNDLFRQAQDLGYDFLTTRITTSAFQSRVTARLSEHLDFLSQSVDAEDVPPIISSLTSADTTLAPDDINASLIAILSPWINLGSSDPIVAHVSRQVFDLEVAYAAFCGINNVVVHGPTATKNVTQYARAIYEGLGLGPYLHLQVLLPMAGELEQDRGDDVHLSEMARTSNEDEVEEEDDELDSYCTWDMWNTIRTICSYSQKVSIALELPQQLPSLSLQSRWYSEPIRLLIFPRTSFLRNAKGYPVLSKPHQQILSQFARLRFPPWMLLSDVDYLPSTDRNQVHGDFPDPTPGEAFSKSKEKPKDPVPHLRYLRHLQQSQPPRPPMERFGQGYQDYLQSPLQPLTDNLESITYEVFEKDPVKYEWYEKAIGDALIDLDATMQGVREVIVAVVGAGRGPLVTRALQASQKTGIAVRCWAVERNPNAFVLLQRRNATDSLWNGEVKVIKSDMRRWPGPNISDGIGKVDILVSELLGSFADNELSPECLDGVQHVLHPEHGVSIPQSYSAHLTPISAPRLHGDLLGRAGTEKWELPYVVMLHQHDYLCTKPTSRMARMPEVKQAWSFAHPSGSAILKQARGQVGESTDAGEWIGSNGSNGHNARRCKLSFICQEPGVCHGLAGYFETVLYEGGAGKTELSTNPLTIEEKSKDMISWFPIFFPVKTPLYIPGGAEVVVSTWRQTDNRIVWYEWVVEIFESTGRKRRKLAMSELHSSRKNGCLM